MKLNKTSIILTILGGIFSCVAGLIHDKKDEMDMERMIDEKINERFDGPIEDDDDIETVEY